MTGASGREGSSRKAVPTISIGGVEMPRVVLGDRAFLQRYGQGLGHRQSVQLIRKAVLSGLAVAAGDPPSAQALMAATRGHSASCTYHTRNWLHPRKVEPARCAATVLERSGEWGDFDDLAKPLALTDLVSQPLLDWGAIRQDLSAIRRLGPRLVTVGGNWLDFMILMDRRTEATEALTRLSRACSLMGSALGVLTYLGPTLYEENDPLFAELADAVVLPVNANGRGMPQGAERFLRWGHGSSRPLVGIHVLDRGRLAPASALAYAFDSAALTAVVVGARTAAQLKELQVAASLSV